MNVKTRFPVAHFLLLVIIRIGLMPGYLQAQASAGNVTVTISGIRSVKGDIEVRLWRGKDGFPKDDTKAYRRAKVTITDGTASATFTDVPFGEYAVSAFHDENGNQKLDTRFPGIPTEGVGVSNDPHKKFGPPPFSSCRFELIQQEKQIPIVIEY